MAKAALNNGALNTTQIYLKQTERLAQMLSEYGDEQEAATYFTEVEPIMQQTVRLLRVNSTTGPSLPRRQSYDTPLRIKSSRGSSSRNQEKDGYVNLNDVLSTKLIRKDSEASNATLKNLKREQPRPVVAQKPPKLEVRAHVHRTQRELKDYDAPSDIMQTSLEESLMASNKHDRSRKLRTNNEIISNGLENGRIRA